MAFFHASRSLSLALAGLALAGTACADVGGGKSSEQQPAGKAGNQDSVVCNSIRAAIQRDQKAGKRDAVAAGVEGAKSVKGCDVSDLVPSANATASPS